MSDEINVLFEMGNAASKLKQAYEDLSEAEAAEDEANTYLERAAVYKKRSSEKYAEAQLSLNKISEVPLES